MTNLRTEREELIHQACLRVVDYEDVAPFEGGLFNFEFQVSFEMPDSNAICNMRFFADYDKVEEEGLPALLGAQLDSILKLIVNEFVEQ